MKTWGTSPHYIPTDEYINCTFAPLDEQKMKLFSDECDRKCKQVDCYAEFYGSQLVFGFHVLEDYTIYALRLPRVPDLVVNYEPLILFAEYLAMMASIVSLWSGLPAYSLFGICKSLSVAVLGCHKRRAKLTDLRNPHS